MRGMPEFRPPEITRPPLADFRPTIGPQTEKAPEIDESKLGTPIQEKVADILRNAFQGKDSVDISSLHQQFRAAKAEDPSLPTIKIDAKTREITSDGKKIGELPDTLQVRNQKISYTPKTFAMDPKGEQAALRNRAVNTAQTGPKSLTENYTSVKMHTQAFSTPVAKKGDVTIPVVKAPPPPPPPKPVVAAKAQPQARVVNDQTPGYMRSTISSRARDVRNANPEDSTESAIQARAGQIAATTVAMRAAKTAAEQAAASEVINSGEPAVAGVATSKGGEEGSKDSNRQRQQAQAVVNTSEEYRKNLTETPSAPGSAETPGGKRK
ncbi:MAG: hypothetical protein V4534_01820 [Myxococcota bacterium]